MRDLRKTILRNRKAYLYRYNNIAEREINV